MRSERDGRGGPLPACPNRTGCYYPGLHCRRRRDHLLTDSSICQIGIVGFSNDVEIFEYETLVDPLDRFSSVNTRIHGISSDPIFGAPRFGDIYSAIDGCLAGRITVAHSFFDKGALIAACSCHKRAVIETTWLDSVRVAKRAWPELSSHRLNVLTKFLGVRHKHHGALSDARAAGMVIVRDAVAPCFLPSGRSAQCHL